MKKNVLSSRLFGGLNSSFEVTMSQIDTENDKNPKIFHQFPKFLPIFC